MILNQQNLFGRIITSKRFTYPLIALFGIFIFFGSFGTVGVGERGIKTRFSAIAGGPLNEGLYIKLPIIESVRKMDIKIQKEQVDADAASKDLQTVHTTVALNFHVDPDRVVDIYQNIGVDYKSRLIDPALQEAVKASVAKFTAEELITKRELVKEDIKNHLKDRITSHGIAVDEFNIVNFQFSQAFEAAIETKVTAEQNALAAKNKLQQVQFEAEQAVASAKGKAEAISIESRALLNNPQVLNLRMIEKWDGKLPQVTDGNPFLNLTLR